MNKFQEDLKPYSTQCDYHYDSVVIGCMAKGQTSKEGGYLMTGNQINFMNYLETSRSNLARETETARHNRVGEGETSRHNLATETETARSNRANETENKRSHLANEALTSSANAETVRSHKANERLTKSAQKETKRHNKRTEALQKYGTDKALEGTKYSADKSKEGRVESASISAQASMSNAALQSKTSLDVANINAQAAKDVANIKAWSDKEIAAYNRETQIALHNIDNAFKKYEADQNTATKNKDREANSRIQYAKNQLDRLKLNITRIQTAIHEQNWKEIERQKIQLEQWKTRIDEAYKEGMLNSQQYRDLVNIFDSVKMPQSGGAR